MLRSRAAQRAVMALMLGGPLVGAAAFQLGRSQERERTLVLLGHRLETRAVAITKDLAATESSVLACGSLFVSAPNVTPEQFRACARATLGQHPALRALQWIPRVTAEARAGHERLAQAAGRERYRISERKPGGELAPAGFRNEYFPVLYVEPSSMHEATVGLDLASDALLRETILTALARRSPTLSDPAVGLGGTDREPTVVTLAPVYADHGELGQPAEAGPLGFVGAVLSLSALVQGSYRPPGDALAFVGLELVDERAGRPPQVLYALPHRYDGEPGPVVSAPVDADGKRWALRTRASQGALAAGRTAQPPELAVASFLGWEGLLGALLLLMRRGEETDRRRQAHLVNSVIDTLSEGVVVADRDGRFLFANRFARRVVGDGAHDVPPESWSGSFGLYVPDKKTPFPTDQLPLQRAIRGETVSDVEIYVRNPRFENGIWINVNGSPLHNEDGEIVGGVAVFRDVTAHRRSHELLQRLSSAVQQTADAVIITDRSGVIEYVNPAFETMTGFTAEEALGQTPRILRSGRQDASYYKTLWATILAGKPFRGSPVNTRKDGTLFHGEQTITPITSRTGEITHFVSVLRDITERRRIEEQAIEMSLAASVQRKLFPSRPPCVPGHEIAGTTSPSLATCGDYYDFIPLKDGSFALVVADVCGHGLGPALIMAQTRAQLRALTRTHSDLTEIFNEISSALQADLEDNLFVTMSLASLSPNGGNLRWINAGHPSGYVIDGSGTVKTVMTSTGLPLGLLPDRGYKMGHGTALEPGDLILLCTDGVIEAESPEGHAFGIDRMLATVRENLSEPVDQIVARLREEVHAHVGNGGLADDLTVVACRRTVDS